MITLRYCGYAGFGCSIRPTSTNININIMGFFGNVLSAVVKTALTPVAIVKDAIDVVQGEESANKKN